MNIYIEMIAAFMGHEGQHEEWCGNNILIDDLFSETGKVMVEYRPNTCWDQLMPVVEKIESMGYGFTIDPWGIIIIEYLSGDEKEIVSFINDDNYPKIFQYFTIVVNFIKWHNERPPHQDNTRP